MSKSGLSSKQIGAALTAKAGNVSEAARALGVTRWGLQKRINQSAELQQVLKDAREEMVDIAESVARQEIRNGNTAMTIFVLKTLGKERGYVERQEISGADGGPLLILDR